MFLLQFILSIFIQISVFLKKSSSYPKQDQNISVYIHLSILWCIFGSYGMDNRKAKLSLSSQTIKSKDPGHKMPKFPYQNACSFFFWKDVQEKGSHLIPNGNRCVNSKDQVVCFTQGLEKCPLCCDLGPQGLFLQEEKADVNYIMSWYF